MSGTFIAGLILLLLSVAQMYLMTFVDFNLSEDRFSFWCAMVTGEFLSALIILFKSQD